MNNSFSGECVPTGDQKQHRGGHRGASEEENGSGSPGDPENGHHGPHDPRQEEHEPEVRLQTYYNVVREMIIC